MTALSYKRIAGVCLVVFVLPLIAACTSTQPSTNADAPSSQPLATSSNGSDCADPEFSRDQFVGSWREPDSTVVTTLDDDGSLKQLIDSESKTGKWHFIAWRNTPADDRMPEAAAAMCVVWLSINYRDNVPLDVVYRPLTVTENSIELSYVGRGNTVEWIREKPPA